MYSPEDLPSSTRAAPAKKRRLSEQTAFRSCRRSRSNVSGEASSAPQSSPPKKPKKRAGDRLLLRAQAPRFLASCECRSEPADLDVRLPSPKGRRLVQARPD